MNYGMMYDQGDLVLVTFPFTDLSSKKMRPALVISPKWFNAIKDDVILAAITSSDIETLEENLEIVISQEDICSGMIERDSKVKIGKIFTCDSDIVIKKVAEVKDSKLKEILSKIQELFVKEETVSDDEENITNLEKQNLSG